jgi:hypothetical protein
VHFGGLEIWWQKTFQEEIPGTCYAASINLHYLPLFWCLIINKNLNLQNIIHLKITKGNEKKIVGPVIYNKFIF